MIIEAREDTITLRGAVKTNIWPAIQAAAALLLENHPTGIIIDCSDITEFTRQGAETFADAFAYIQAHNARIVLAGLSPELAEIGKSVPEVRSQLPIAANVDEAHASLQLEELTPRRGRARQAAVVPMLGNWRRAVYHADKLALGENCEVHLVDLIKIPRTHAIGAPLPEREAAGRSRLEAAALVVKETRLKSFSHVERVRSYSAGLARFVDELSADFAVVSLEPGEEPDCTIEESDAITLLGAANCEVSLIKGAATQQAGGLRSAIVPAIGDWGHAIEHACKLVSGKGAVVTAVYLITIPHTEPIDAPKPDAEAAAADFAKEAIRIGKKRGVNVQPITQRVRDPVLGFEKMVASSGCHLVVVGVTGEMDSDYPVAHAAAAALLQEPPCETVFLRAARPH